MTDPTVNFPMLFGPPATYYSQSDPGPYCTISDTQYILSMPSGVRMDWNSPGEMNVFQEYTSNFGTLIITVIVSNIVAGTEVYLFRKAFKPWGEFDQGYYIQNLLVNGSNTFQINSVIGNYDVSREQIGIMVISPNSGVCTCNVISVSFGKSIPTIGILNTQSPKTYGDAPYILQDPTSNSTGMFSYSSSDTNIATINGNIVTIIGVGTCNIIALQAETVEYASGTTSSPLEVKANSASNPVQITNSENLQYFLNTMAIYGELTNNIVVYESLISQLNAKILVNGSSSFIKITREVIL